MDRDLLAIILMLVSGVGVVVGIVFSWRLSTGARRGLTMVGLLGLFLLLCYLLIQWVTSGGGTTGTQTVLMAMLVIPVISLVALICASVTAFTTWVPTGKRPHAAWIWASVGLLALAAVALIFNQSIMTWLGGQALDDPDPAIRAKAVQSLGSLGDVSSIPVIAEMLKDSTSVVRSQAVWALVAIGDGSAAPEIRKVLDDNDPEVRMAAIYGCFGLGDSLTVDELIPFLADSSNAVREAAITELDLVDSTWHTRRDIPVEYWELE